MTDRPPKWSRCICRAGAVARLKERGGQGAPDEDRVTWSRARRQARRQEIREGGLGVPKHGPESKSVSPKA